jgi:hypothetical protein
MPYKRLSRFSGHFVIPQILAVWVEDGVFQQGRDFSPATGDYAHRTLPFAVGMMGSKDMDRSSTF